MHILRRNMQTFCRIGRKLGILPENTCAALRGNNRKDRIFKHIQLIRNGKPQGTAAAAFPNDNRNNRRFQSHHLHKVIGNRLSLSAFLCLLAAECTGGIHKTDDRSVEFFRLSHQAQCLAIAFGHGAAEIAADSFFQIASAFNADKGCGDIPQHTDAADNCRIIGIFSVPMQLRPLLKQLFDIGTRRRAGLTSRRL